MGMIYAPPSIIPNGALINGVCHIYQSTKPTTRPDGSALMIGDIWYKIDDITQWFWNGTYWLSSLEYMLATAAANNLSVTTNQGMIESALPLPTSDSLVSGQLNLFLTKAIINSREMLTNDDSNYWRFTFGSQNGFGAAVGFTNSPTFDTIGSVSTGVSGRRKKIDLNILLTAIPYNVTCIVTKVGSPSNLVAQASIWVRSVFI